MAPQEGHRHRLPGRGAAGLCVAEVVEDGQDLPVAVGAAPAVGGFAEDMAVGTGNAVFRAAEVQMEKFGILPNRHGCLVIGQKPQPGILGLDGVVVAFGDHGVTSS